jgi:signal transduction histidine kinase
MSFTAKLDTAERQMTAATADLRRFAASPLSDVVIGLGLALLGFLQFRNYQAWMLLGAVMLATLPHTLRRTYPFPVAVLTLSVAAILVSQYYFWSPPIAIHLSVSLAVYTLLCRFNRRMLWVVGASATAVALIMMAAPNRGGDEFWLFTAVGLAAATFLADVRGSRTEVDQVRADNLDGLREQAAMAERARIAREMHDVVAHSVSMIAVRAETAPYTISDLNEPAKAEFAEIATAAREGLAEMRRLLGVLRADVPATAETAPQPGLARLPELIEEHGGPVDLDIVGDEFPLPQAVDVSAYRIAQEALANARAHAPGARVSIELAYRPDVLVVRVADDGPGPGSATNQADSATGPTGHGLIGMRERALMLGGWFSAGAGPHGGFLLQAGLPIE